MIARSWSVPAVASSRRRFLAAAGRRSRTASGCDPDHVRSHDVAAARPHADPHPYRDPVACPSGGQRGQHRQRAPRGSHLNAPFAPGEHRGTSLARHGRAVCPVPCSRACRSDLRERAQGEGRMGTRHHRRRRRRGPRGTQHGAGLVVVELEADARSSRRLARRRPPPRRRRVNARKRNEDSSGGARCDRRGSRHTVVHAVARSPPLPRAAACESWPSRLRRPRRRRTPPSSRSSTSRPTAASAGFAAAAVATGGLVDSGYARHRSHLRATIRDMVPRVDAAETTPEQFIDSGRRCGGVRADRGWAARAVDARRAAARVRRRAVQGGRGRRADAVYVKVLRATCSSTTTTRRCTSSTRRSPTARARARCGATTRCPRTSPTTSSSWWASGGGRRTAGGSSAPSARARTSTSTHSVPRRGTRCSPATSAGRSSRRRRRRRWWRRSTPAAARRSRGGATCTPPS